jgi:probable HAF family extracellular repeat protein
VLQVHCPSSKCCAVLAAASIWLSPCAEVNAATPFFMGLGDLPGGTFYSSATGVSADGTVVVGTASAASGNQAFRWTLSSGMVGLGGTSTAADVSANGSVIVGQRGSEAFRWTQATGAVGLGDFPRGLFQSAANAVSADGSVVVGRGASETCGRGGCRNTFPAFRWTHSTGMVALGIGTAMDISADGSVIVGGSSQAARWTQDSVGESLGDLPGGSVNSFAWGVSADGSVVVGTGNSESGLEAFRWTRDSGMVGLGVLSGFDFSVADDLSADGSVVVGYVGVGAETHAGAFIWDGTRGMRNLRDELIVDLGLGANLAGWTLKHASAISADGRVIVGYGTNPAGDTEAWIAGLGAVPRLFGDFNNDGSVDAADYVVWRSGLGAAYTQADYNVWRADFGQTRGSGESLSSAQPLPAAVPEPLTFSLVLLALVIMFNRF